MIRNNKLHLQYNKTENKKTTKQTRSIMELSLEMIYNAIQLSDI